jgi:peptide/nickel transport system permease protein
MKWINYKKTIVGLTILALLLVLSFLYPLYGPKDFNKVMFLYDEKGDLLGVPPIPPSSHYLLGSDRNGADILLMMIYGAKFTLLMAFGVTFLRVVVGGLLGIIFSLWLNRLLPIVRDFLLVYRMIPAIIIALPLMSKAWVTASWDTIYSILFYQMLVLAFVGIPSVLLSTTEIIDHLKRESFMQSSYLMGANHFHVLKTQLKPFLKSYGIVMALQHLINTLGLIMFFGAFGFYIGGISPEEVRGLETPNSFTKEWAGLIGQNYQEFNRAPYIVLAPLFSYFFIIIIIHMIKKEIETFLELNHLGFKLKKKRKKKKKLWQERQPNSLPTSSHDFTFQRNQL